MDDCIYCKIINGEIKVPIVYEDDTILVFLEQSPSCYGHSIIVPKAHEVSLTAVPAETASAMLHYSQELGRAMCRTKTWDGFNLRIDNGECAGQVVSHCAMHVIPRVGTDGFYNNWRKLAYDSVEHSQDVLDHIQERLKK